MEIETHGINKQIPSKEKIRLSNIEGYTIQNMRQIVEYLTKLSVKTNNEKEILFTEIHSLVSSIASANFFTLIDNIQFEDRENYLVNTFLPKVLKEIANSSNDSLTTALKDKMISVVKVLLKEFILAMPNGNASSTSKFFPIWEATVDLFLDIKPFNKSKNPSKKLDISEAYLEHIYSNILNPRGDDWKKEIKKDSVIDYLIRKIDHKANDKLQYGRWSRAVVTEIDSNQVAKVKVQENEDIEQVSLKSNLILPQGTISLDFDNTRADQRWNNPLESFIPFIVNQKKLYALPRKSEVLHHDVDWDYIDLIIFFGEIGGFEQINKSLSVMASNNSSIDEVKNEFIIFIEFIWNIFNYLHTEFCKTFLEDFVSSSLKYLSEMSMITDNRGFPREKTESLMKKIKEIMKKIYTDQEVNIKYGVFSLETGITLIKSSMLDKKLIGMKLISDMLNDVATIGMTTNPSSISFLEYLHKENVFDVLFGAHSHTQIFQKGGDLIKALSKCNLFNEEQLGKLWAIANETTDINLAIAIYKSLKESAPFMNYSVKKTLLQLIVSSNTISQKGLYGLLLEVLQSLQRSLPKNESRETFKSIGVYMTDLIFTSASPETQNAAITEYLLFLKGLNFPEVRIECMDNLLKRITEKLSSRNDFSETALHLKVLRRIVNSLTTIKEEVKKNQLFTLINEQYHTVPLLIDYMQIYTQATKDILFHNANANIDLISYHHNDLITEFFSFINLMITHSQGKLKLTTDHIKILFEIFVESPILFPNGNTANEANLFFKFLKEAELRRAIPEDSLTYVFTLMNTSKVIALDNVSFDLVNLIWNLFISINKANGKLRLSEKAYMSKSSYSTLKSYFDTITVITLTSKVEPQDLEGFDLIFKVLISSPTEISQKVVRNFILLYSLNDRSANERGEIYSKLIQKAIESITDNFSGDLLLHNAIRVLNSFELLGKIIEESERQGTGGAVSHSTIHKAAVICLNVFNLNLNFSDIEYQPFSIKLFINTTVWDLKKFIANKLQLQPGVISLKTALSLEIPDTCHGKTIEEMKLSNNEMLSITRNPKLDMTEKLPLIERGALTENFKRVLTDIFYCYASCTKVSEKSNVNKNQSNTAATTTTEMELCMNKEDVIRFTQGALNSKFEIPSDDSRIVKIFEKYDTDQDGLITLNNFVSFYHDAVVVDKREGVAWENLKNLGYRNDLKKITDPIEEFELKKEYMPRWMISATPGFFEVLIGIQERLSESRIDVESAWGDVMKGSFSFLSLICTNPSIYRDILSLERLRSPDDWGLYVNETSHYRQLYSLQIIDSFFEDFVIGRLRVDIDPFDSSILEAKDLELLDPPHRIAWLDRFISSGGLELILKIFLHTGDDILTCSYIKKKCLSMIMKIIQSCVLIILLSSKSMNSDKQEILKSYSHAQYKMETAMNNEPKDETTILNKNLSRNLSIEVIRENLFSLLNTKYKKSLVNKFLYGGTCNYKILVTKLLQIVKLILTNSQDCEDNRLILSSSTLLLGTILISVENFTEMRAFLFSKEKFNFEELIIQGILMHNNRDIRLNVYQTLKNLCENLIQLKDLEFATNVVSIVQGKLFGMMSSSNKTERENCANLFDLLENLLGFIFTAGGDNQKTVSYNYSDMAYNIYEVLSNTENVIEDAMLSGYIRLLTILVKYDTKLNTVLTSKDKNLIPLLVDKLTLKESKFPLNPSLKDIPFNLKSLEDASLIEQNLSTIATWQSDEIRNNIFQLILSLIDTHPANLLTLFGTKLPKYPVMISKKTMATYYNPSNDKRSCGFVGIKNLGAICYINSVIQQFFHVPSFRYAVMQIDDQRGFTEDPENPACDDNVLHQLQKMFSFLELSNRLSFTPDEFCWSFKDSFGQRVNTQVQQDSQEFLTRFFSNMEASTEKTPYKYLMQSMFGGKTCSQVICKDCGNVNNNFEDFYNFSLEVKNMKSLSESLDKFTSEERIDGYKCSNCDKMTTVTKRNSLASLPNILIVHLQRIVYNYDINNNEKVNSCLEFPRVLNLKSQSTEDVTNKLVQDLSQEKKDMKDNKINEFNDRVYERVPEYYEYTLVGVVVHSGHAESGHYFSYINTSRNGMEHSWNNDPNDTNWINFNDSFVSPFDLTTLEMNCFGGSSPVGQFASDNLWAPSCPPLDYVVGTQSDPQAVMVIDQPTPPTDLANNAILLSNTAATTANPSMEVGQSAYMLIYERKIKSPIKIVNIMKDITPNVQVINEKNRYQILKEYDLFHQEIFNNPSILKNIVYHDIYDEDKKESFFYAPFYSLPKKIPTIYFMNVINDNIEFYNDQKIFNANFNEFLEKTVECLERGLRNSEISNDHFEYIFLVILRFLLDVISKSAFKDRIKEIVEKIQSIQTVYPKICYTILGQLIEKIEKLYELLFSSEETANEGYKNLFKYAILCYIDQDYNNCRNYVNSFGNEAQKNNSGDILQSPLAFVLLDSILEMVPVRLTKFWTKLQSYLALLIELAQSGNPLIIEYFVKKDLLGNCIDFFLQSNSPYYNKSDNRTEMGKNATPKFEPLFTLIEALLSHYRCSKDVSDISPYPQLLDDQQQVQIKAFTFTEKDEKLLNLMKFYELATKDNFNNMAVGQIMSHMMYNNYDFTKTAMLFLITSLNKGLGLRDARNFFQLIAEVFLMEDMYSTTRLEWIFGIPIISIAQKGCQAYINYRLTSSGYPADFLFSFKTFIPQTSTSHTSLVEKILTKYWWSSEFLSIMNSLYNDVLYHSPSALSYFDSLPNPKPRYFDPGDAKLKSYITELAKDSSFIKKSQAVYSAWAETLTQYDKFLNYYRKNFNKPEWNFHLLNFNYRPGFIFSDVVSVCDHLPTYIHDELLEKGIYLFTFDYEIDYITWEFNDNTTVIPSYRVKFYPPIDGIPPLKEHVMYWDLLKEERELELFLLSDGLALKKHRRSFKAIIKGNEKVTPLIRRYSILNLSEVSYQLAFQFQIDDISTLNTHLPHSEVLAVCKAKTLQHVITLYKEDYSKEFGKYTVLVTPTVYTEVKPPESSPKKEPEASKSKAKNQESEGKGKDSKIGGWVDQNQFQVVCDLCGKANLFTGMEEAYVCQYCQEDLF